MVLCMSYGIEWVGTLPEAGMIHIYGIFISLW